LPFAVQKSREAGRALSRFADKTDRQSDVQPGPPDRPGGILGAAMAVPLQPPIFPFPSLEVNKMASQDLRAENRELRLKLQQATARISELEAQPDVKKKSEVSARPPSEKKPVEIDKPFKLP